MSARAGAGGPELFANTELVVRTTSIPGLLVVDLVLHGDERGWFKESFQREKLVGLGLPADFAIVQNNVSSNRERGVTRGIHAEPWNKYISLTRGQVHAAIVDLRSGANFGAVEQFRLTPAQAIFVPRGCGNSYQTLTPDVEYSYLVDAHWSPDARYTSCNLGDADLAIDWPIPLEQAIISDKDRAHPRLRDVVPVTP
ncbi:MAG: dTDP-4-keto-6-deoxy-D-glucose epimerase [Jatrophihabitans sp.]|nr:MAG: dTDP-4-keto-6-deoxy-D-glucose epimerase [Jatrophihabitans sp.]